MAALWLPATQHCELDALGLIEAHVVHHDHNTGCATHGDETQHAHDTCVPVKSVASHGAALRLKPPPSKISRLDTRAAPALSPPPLPHIPQSATRVSHFPRDFRPDWFPSRHFADRAAPMPRAPSPAPA